mmetsp:Transcript_16503/g.64376  ORF Transcript_16503/g.64376 Transcript_16503/m.64376 type:complete len:513 (+) Transcript_16503:861-2399(+)
MAPVCMGTLLAWEFRQAEALVGGRACPGRAHEGTDGDQRAKQQRDLQVIDDAVGHLGLGHRCAQPAMAGQHLDAVAQHAAQRYRQPARGGLHGAPGAQRQTGAVAAVQPHGHHQRADGEQACTQADEHVADAEQPARCQRCGKDDGRKGTDAHQQTDGSKPVGVKPPLQQPRRDREGQHRAQRHAGRQQAGGGHRQLQDRAAIGFEHDVLHVEGRGSERHGDKKTSDLGVGGKALPDGPERHLRLGVGLAHRLAARLLFPKRDQVEEHRGRRRALHHAHQARGAEALQHQAEHRAGHHHAEQQHHIHQRHHARAGVSARLVRGQRQACGLRRLHAGPHHDEGQGRSRMPNDRGSRWRTRFGARLQQDQRERHDGQAAELQQRAEPEVGHPAPAQGRQMGVRAIAHQRSKRSGQQRQRHHQRDQPGGHAQLDDHDPVQRTDQQCIGHADRDLEQRQTQQARQRQLGGGRIGKRQEVRAEARPLHGQALVELHDGFHGAPTASSACRPQRQRPV